MPNEHMGLIGRKLGMSQLFEENGDVIAVTIVETGPCTVLQVKTEAGKDAYNAIQVGFGSKKKSRIKKAQVGHSKAAGLTDAPSEVVREFRLCSDDVKKYKVGDTLKATDCFQEGDRIDVCGKSKGCGFAGVMKRYNFAGFMRSHGTHEFFRHGGSIGTRLTPGHVQKGKAMPGHMGNKRVTVENLAVAKIDEERNLVFIRGGIPGPNGAVVIIRHTTKT
jgi:large subunit ribosomal protein L3